MFCFLVECNECNECNDQYVEYDQNECPRSICSIVLDSIYRWPRGHKKEP